MKIIEPRRIHHFYDGVLEGEGVEHYQKKYKEIDSIYVSKDTLLDPETIMYEVYSFNEGGPGVLLMGLTVMYPITVSGECNMTRGHYHLHKDEPEIYFGCEGEGLLLMMKDGEAFAEKVFQGSVHYIKGEYAHRIINTGDSVFKVGAFWRELAGHDYESIEKKPFPYRVYKKDGKIEVKQ